MKIGQLFEISTHAPTQGATLPYIENSVAFAFQPTPPHRGRLSGIPRNRARDRISTHAPTQGATVGDNITVGSAVISTHAPTQGATGRFLKLIRAVNYFNPRPHTGGDGAIAAAVLALL